MKFYVATIVALSILFGFRPNTATDYDGRTGYGKDRMTDTIYTFYKANFQALQKKFTTPNCRIIQYDDSSFFSEFEEKSALGDINFDDCIEFVYVLPPLTDCEDGKSYYFSDTNFGRISTDSYCCHTSWLISVGDIDEDGICELGQLYSSCASRYKSLLVLSFKNGIWNEIGQCIFDLNYSDLEKEFGEYIVKTSKNRFKMLEITDLVQDTSFIGKKHWLNFSIPEPLGQSK